MKPKTTGEWIAVIVVAVLAVGIVAIGIGTMGGDAGRGGRTPAPLTCEQRWEANKETADAGAMSREQYIANCQETDRDLRDGKLDGK